MPATVAANTEAPSSGTCCETTSAIPIATPACGSSLGPFLPGSNVNGSGGVTPSTDVFLADTIGDYRANVLRAVARVRF